MKKYAAGIAKSYYLAMNDKDKSTIQNLLHPEVSFAIPVAKLQGKKAVMGWVEGFLPQFQKVLVRAHFGDHHQATVAYEIVFPQPIGAYPAAALMSFKDGLIIGIELFFDTRPLAAK